MMPSWFIQDPISASSVGFPTHSSSILRMSDGVSESPIGDVRKSPVSTSSRYITYFEHFENFLWQFQIPKTQAFIQSIFAKLHLVQSPYNVYLHFLDPSPPQNYVDTQVYFKCVHLLFCSFVSYNFVTHLIPAFYSSSPRSDVTSG